MPKQRQEQALLRHRAQLSAIDTETWAAVDSVLTAMLEDENESIGSSIHQPNVATHPATEYASLQRKAGKAEGIRYANTELFKLIERARKMRYKGF